MASKVPNIKLNSGFNMPIIGLGTWNVSTIYSSFVVISIHYIHSIHTRIIHVYKYSYIVYTHVCVRLLIWIQ